MDAPVAPGVIAAPYRQRPVQPRGSSWVLWAVTVVATAVSTLALDIVAAASGLVLAGSHVLHGMSAGVLVGLLGITYVVWGVALRVNLVANGRLLEESGTSTNVVSKTLFELARVRSWSQRGTRAAAAAGYVATEIAKEAPYYAGAYGTALLSDTVDATDALVFLAGTNLGAAVYEYSVARLSHRLLDRRSLRRPTAGSMTHS
jgi:hypothetical protein